MNTSIGYLNTYLDSVIEPLYPPDSVYSDTRKIGFDILIECLVSYNWRKLPEDLKIKIARENLKKEWAGQPEYNSVLAEFEKDVTELKKEI